jgi:hypothetical protein
MAKSNLVTAHKKFAEQIVGGYKKMESAVVGTYTKIEDRFVDQYLTHDGETVAEAKARLKQDQTDREAASKAAAEERAAKAQSYRH